MCDASGSSYRTPAHTVSLSPPYRDSQIDLSAWKGEVMRLWESDQFVCAIHEAECKLVLGGSMDLSTARSKASRDEVPFHCFCHLWWHLSFQFQRSQTASSHIQAPGAVISLPASARPPPDRTLAALSFAAPHRNSQAQCILPEACRGQERIWKASPPFHAVTTHPRSWTFWDLWHGGPWPCPLQHLSTNPHSGSSSQG